jgi:dienelactone hydrolase
MRSILFFMLLAFFPPSDAGAREIGSGRETAMVQGMPITVFTYRPADCARPALLFVFHGKNRKAMNMRNNARPLADRICLVVMAPELDRRRFPNWRFQRAGVVRKGRVQPRAKWTDAVLVGLVDWARRQEGRPDMPYYLFGHSAGAQFLSRIAAYSPPPGVKRIIIANPSVHVLATLDEPAPYGMGGVFDKTNAEERIKSYLRLPVTIFLGTEDKGTKNLVSTAAAFRQGVNRFERGKTAFAYAESLAKTRGWAFNWKLLMVPGIGHFSRGMLNSSQAVEAIGQSYRLAPP